MFGEPETGVDQDADAARRVLEEPGPQLVGYIDPVGVDTDDLRLGDLAATLARVAMRPQPALVLLHQDRDLVPELRVRRPGLANPALDGLEVHAELVRQLLVGDPRAE